MLKINNENFLKLFINIELVDLYFCAINIIIKSFNGKGEHF